jgi:hypothetical protein
MFDGPDLPLTMPLLQLLLSRDCRGRIVEDFIVHQLVNAIFGREPRDILRLVLMDSTDQVIGNPDVQCAVLAAGKNVHVAIHIETAGVMDSGTRFARPE